MQTSQFRAVLDRINQLQARDDDYPDLLKQMHQLAALAPLSVASVHGKGVRLFRSTAHHTTIPSHIEEISFPPSHACKTFGRANKPGKSLFYCCSDPAGALLETKVGVGRYAVIGTWQTTSDMTLHGVGYAEAAFSRAGAARRLADTNRELYGRLGPELAPIRDYLELAFTDPEPSHYRVTTAIAEMFMAADGVAGIMYPSVAKGTRVDNVALLPEFVRTSLKLAEAAVLYIDTASPKTIQGQVVARLNSERDGKLSWSYSDSFSTTIGPGDATLGISPGERKRLTSIGRTQIDDRTYDVSPGYSIELVDGDVAIFDLQGKRVDPIG